MEQPLHKNEVHVRIKDYASHAWGQTNVTCQIFEMDEDGKADLLIGSIILKQDSPDSGNYSGSFTWKDFPAHGVSARVVYKSKNLKYPISTWCSFYYH